MKISPDNAVNIIKKSITIANNSANEIQKVSKSNDELPRFSSPEMIMARTLNKIAIRQTRTGKIFTYPKANVQDLQRLTSETLEASYGRVSWTNPKDGKIYHLLKESDLGDDKILVRILNEDGSFLKNAEIMPQKIILVDDFETVDGFYGLTHGEMTSTYLRRHNPFAKIETINIGYSSPQDKRYLDAYKQILERIENGEKIDYVSCSLGSICYSTKRCTIFNPLPELQIFSEIANKGTRVLFASGNSKDAAQTTNQVLLVSKKAEGVGSISPKTHRLSEFSASRNSQFTQHYEVGEYHIRPTAYGANITGLAGTDIIINDTRYNQQIAKNILIGKTKDRVDKLLEKINNEISENRAKKFSLFGKGKPNFDELRRIEERQSVLEKRKRKIYDFLNFTKLDGDVYEGTIDFFGTSFAAPIRTAKLALNDMLKDML